MAPNGDHRSTLVDYDYRFLAPPLAMSYTNNREQVDRLMEQLIAEEEEQWLQHTRVLVAIDRLQQRAKQADSALRETRDQLQLQISQLQSQLAAAELRRQSAERIIHGHGKVAESDLVHVLISAATAPAAVVSPLAVSFGAGLRKGDQADCLDAGSWLLVEVLDTDSDRVFVHHIGWKSKWDEWIRKDSARLQPPRTHTRGYTGSRSLAPFHGEVLLDSGATHHSCNDRRLFRKIEHTTPLSIVGFSGESATAYEKGEVALVLQGGGTLVLTDVSFSSRLKGTIVSVPQLTSAGYAVAFDEQRATLKKGDTVCELSRRVHRYLFDIFLPAL